MELKVSELAKRLNAELAGDGHGVVCSVKPIDAADKNAVTFLANDSRITELKKSNAGACLVAKAVDGLAIPQVVVKNVNAALIETLGIFAPKLPSPAAGIHPTAQVGSDVKIGKNASIGPYVVIETGACIGDDTVIAAGCKIGPGTKIGAHCRLDCNVVVYHNCVIGNNVVIQAGSVIGSVGFGYAFIDGAHRLIPHNGIVVIEDFVEIGANCCVDRAKFGETRIGAGTKIDNLVQVAHNVSIGKCCLIIAQVGIAGSCKIGDGVVLAGQAGVADNIEIGDGAIVGAKSGVTKNIQPGKRVFGTPAAGFTEFLRATANLYRLPKTIEQFKKLSARIDKLESQGHEEKNKKT
jgi:UDP-3-O-[3-hydroxymyristoyl] glucosamine N-acyltransferase